MLSPSNTDVTYLVFENKAYARFVDSICGKVYAYRKGRPGTCSVIYGPQTHNKPNYTTTSRKIRSAAPRVPKEPKNELEKASPNFELTRTATSIEMKVQIEDTETKERLKVVEEEKTIDPETSLLQEEILKLKQQILDLEERLHSEREESKKIQHQLQLDFNKNLSSILDEKKKELKRVKEQNYADINAIKTKMNETMRQQRNETSLTIAKLKGELDSSRESCKQLQSKQEKLKLEHSEDLQDLENELNMKHQREKNKLLRELEEKLVQEKKLELELLKTKQDDELELIRKQHDQELKEILNKFDGISVEEVDENRRLIREQQKQLTAYRIGQEKLEAERREMLEEITQHKATLKQLQDSFYDKVSQVDKKYNYQLSSLLIDNKDLRKQYLKKCEELFTLKSSYNRLTEAKSYIAKEVLSAVMQGKQPHIITSSAVKANWSSAGLNNTHSTTTLDTFDDSSRRSSEQEDPAALLLSTSPYVQSNNRSTQNPKPLSESLFGREDFDVSTADVDLITKSEDNLNPEVHPMGRLKTTPVRTVRPTSSVCVVRPHSRQSETRKSRVQSADSRNREVTEMLLASVNLPKLIARSNEEPSSTSKLEDET